MLAQGFLAKHKFRSVRYPTIELSLPSLPLSPLGERPEAQLPALFYYATWEIYKYLCLGHLRSLPPKPRLPVGFWEPP